MIWHDTVWKQNKSNSMNNLKNLRNWNSVEFNQNLVRSKRWLSDQIQEGWSMSVYSWLQDGSLITRERGVKQWMFMWTKWTSSNEWTGARWPFKRWSLKTKNAQKILAEDLSNCRLPLVSYKKGGGILRLCCAKPTEWTVGPELLTEEPTVSELSTGGPTESKRQRCEAS